MPRPPTNDIGPTGCACASSYNTLENHPKCETYRLMTTLLDHVQAPALELAALYPERWEMEGVFDELKTHLRGGQQVVLRSKTPRWSSRKSMACFWRTGRFAP